MTSIPPATLFERALYVGITLQNILYGVEVILYLRTMQIFLARRRKPHQFDVFFAAFSTVMFFLITGWIAADARLGKILWLQDRNYPGGPMAYLISPSMRLYNHYDAAVTIILQQMTDGLMVWRCRVVWDSLHVIIIPCFLWLATLLFGILAAATQETNPFIGISIKFMLVDYTISVFLSATLTCMICFRLWRHARGVKECIGAEFASPYINTAMLFVESVLPYTLTGIVFLVMYGIGNELGIAFSRVYTLMMCLSPQMLILRVAEGTAWQKNTMKPHTSMVMFKPGGDTSYSSGSDGSGAVRMHHMAEPTLQGESSKSSGECGSHDQSLGTTIAETGSRSLDSKM
ncbi:hypothetical protein HD554DRAFT_625863 [Boletus coccyginus]|nr:hypothetical protein HD554DRAFT_625863 [Boletus coccyginus]